MEKLVDELNILKNNLDSLPNKNLSELDLNRTCLVIVDLNNGFAKKGALYSPRIEALINPITTFANSVSKDINSIIAFTDCHSADSLELKSYPLHCLTDDVESDIVDELKEVENLKVINKNSTNGFFALEDVSFNGIDNIIVVGDCTDICIYQFTVTLRSYFNEKNIDKNIIVPVDLVDTYHIDSIHNAELLNIVFLNSMIQNGIEVVSKIIY